MVVVLSVVHHCRLHQSLIALCCCSCPIWGNRSRANPSNKTLNQSNRSTHRSEWQPASNRMKFRNYSSHHFLCICHSTKHSEMKVLRNASLDITTAMLVSVSHQVQTSFPLLLSCVSFRNVHERSTKLRILNKRPINLADSDKSTIDWRYCKAPLLSSNTTPVVIADRVWRWCMSILDHSRLVLSFSRVIIALFAPKSESRRGCDDGHSNPFLLSGNSVRTPVDRFQASFHCWEPFLNSANAE